MSNVSRDRRTALVGISLTVVALIVFLAPSFVALKGPGSPERACDQRGFPAGYLAGDLDQARGATFDLFAETLVCEWGPYRGDVYVSTFRVGSSALHVAAAAVFGAGLTVTAVAAGGAFRRARERLS